MTIKTGEFAPAFTLPDRPGHEVDVGARIGGRPVVLLFFPLAFSSVCTSELCRMRDDWTGWQDMDADVFAISVDSPFVTERFRAQLDLPFPLLSDFNREVARKYGVLYETFYGLKGVAKRAVFVLDRSGRVAYRWVSEDADLEPDYDAVRFAAAQAGRPG